MDERRRVPRTDVLLADPRLAGAARRLGRDLVKAVVAAAQERARAGEIAPEAVADEAVAALPASAASLRPVVNATGVLLHTNLGRAPLSVAARDALMDAAGCTDVEFDLETGRRGRRGRGTLAALAEACPAAEAAHVVNNNAAALVLAATVLAQDREIVISRGEMVEIGDGFRLPDLLVSTGARLREVGTTNRTTAADYADAVGPGTGFVLKVHPSNFRVEGFTAQASLRELSGMGVPLVADIGSGLLAPEPVLPDEPDAATALADGADLVTASGDKLLGGPQAGLLLGRADLIERLRRHPLARALRVGKLTLAALEASLRGPEPPAALAVHADVRVLRERAELLAEELTHFDALAVESVARVGGGGAPGVELPSAAVSLPEACTVPLRRAGIVGRAEGGRLLLDLRGVPADLDPKALARRVAAVLAGPGDAGAVVHVVATAGHVDHGKSTLVRALTGMEPDRWAEERRRGMTIDLGFAWTGLPSGEQVAFVDVPGHERFVTTMLAGVGPVPAAMVVVAADEGWMPQSAEHLAALDALGVRHGLLVVTRADRADPGPALAQARAELARTGLRDLEALAVSGVTGQGLPDLRAALGRLADGLPEPDAGAPVRIWIDRAFTIKGSGTVVTGTLPAGTVRAEDELLLGDRPVRVRALQTLKEPAGTVTAVARVAVNLRGVERDDVARGMALTDGAWTATDVIDVRVAGADGLPREPVLHLGSAAVPVRLRPLGADAARLTLRRALPLHVGDRVLLRDPGARRVVGADVLDVRPPELRRRGAAAARARELAEGSSAETVLRRHGLIRRADLRAMGLTSATEPVAGDWLADPGHWADLRRRLAEEAGRHADADPLEPGLPVEAARALLGLPDRRLVDALAAPPLRVAGGRVHASAEAGLPAPVAEAVRRLRADLAERPFHAPEAGRLAELGLTGRALGAAVRAGALLRIADGIVLPPGADAHAARVLAALPQPFTVSEARRALGTSRRVAVPLLEHLDRQGLTVRTGDARRTVTGP